MTRKISSNGGLLRPFSVRIRRKPLEKVSSARNLIIKFITILGRTNKDELDDELDEKLAEFESEFEEKAIPALRRNARDFVLNNIQSPGALNVASEVLAFVRIKSQALEPPPSQSKIKCRIHVKIEVLGRSMDPFLSTRCYKGSMDLHGVLEFISNPMI